MPTGFHTDPHRQAAYFQIAVKLFRFLVLPESALHYFPGPRTAAPYGLFGSAHWDALVSGEDLHRIVAT